MNHSNNEMGMAKAMGSHLLLQVSQQLLGDLSYYGISDSENIWISWHESEGEGNWAKYLDGEIENYAYITILDENMNAIGQGSMDFVLEEEWDVFLVYWDALYFIHPEFDGKTRPGIPDHIWQEIPENFQAKYKGKKIKKKKSLSRKVQRI